MALCIIRHGETVYNLEKRMQGVRDIELSERGKEEAQLLGRKLRSEGVSPLQIFSSPMKRAHSTAENLGFGVPILSLQEFRARSLGHLEGLTESEIRKLYPGAIEDLLKWDYLPPGGRESLRNVFERGNAGVEKILAEIKANEDIVIVTHSGVLQAIMRGWLELKPSESLPFPLRNAAAIFFERKDKKWQALRMVAVGKNEFNDNS
jgi:broad specificity phosphatase PhoE